METISLLPIIFFVVNINLSPFSKKTLLFSNFPILNFGPHKSIKIGIVLSTSLIKLIKFLW